MLWVASLCLTVMPALWTVTSHLVKSTYMFHPIQEKQASENSAFEDTGFFFERSLNDQRLARCDSN